MEVANKIFAAYHNSLIKLSDYQVKTIKEEIQKLVFQRGDLLAGDFDIKTRAGNAQEAKKNRDALQKIADHI